MGTNLLLLLCLVGAATSQEFDTDAPLDLETTDESKTNSTIQTPILRQINQANDDGSYTYGFEAADGTFKVETRDADGNVKGKYGYLDEFGELQVVEYRAGNETGFEHDSDLLPRTVPVPPVPQFPQAPQDFHSSFPVAPPRPPPRPRPHFVPQRVPQRVPQFQRNEVPQTQPAFAPSSVPRVQAQVTPRPQVVRVTPAPRPHLLQTPQTPIVPRPQPVPAPQFPFAARPQTAPSAQFPFAPHPQLGSTPQDPFAPRPQGFPQSQPQFVRQPPFGTQPQLPFRPQFQPQPQFTPHSQFPQRPQFPPRPQPFAPQPIPQPGFQPGVTRTEKVSPSPVQTSTERPTSSGSSPSANRLPASTKKLAAQPQRPFTSQQQPQHSVFVSQQPPPQFPQGFNRFLPQQQQPFAPQQFAQPQLQPPQQLGGFGGAPQFPGGHQLVPQQFAQRPHPQRLTPQVVPHHFPSQ